MHGIEDVDLLVVGGGAAGKSLALDRAKAGWTFAMVERDKIGGPCINVAPIPTKALVASARAMRSARRAGELGVGTGGEPSVVLDRLPAHKEGVVGGMVIAHARRRQADDRGREVVIDTGTTPSLPDLPRPRAGHAVDAGEHPAWSGCPNMLAIFGTRVTTRAGTPEPLPTGPGTTPT